MKTSASRVNNREKMREYDRDYYQRHREAILARKRNRTQRHRNTLRQWLLDYLKTHPCVDCGEADPVVLEFDHREDKQFAIGEACSTGFSLKRVQIEVAKCDVRCANCHRRKTYSERGFNHRS